MMPAARATAVCVLVIVVSGVLEGHPQTISLRDFTVPSERLPNGCVLAPAPFVRESGNRVRGGLWAGLPIDRNPWVGSDPVITAAIRERIAPPARLPDGPPLNPSELARYRLALADGIAQSYAAIYQASDSTALIVVYALEFPTERDADTFRYSVRSSGLLTMGRVIALISGDENDCQQALSAHIRSLR
jgi:hypothetical protein